MVMDAMPGRASTMKKLQQERPVVNTAVQWLLSDRVSAWVAASKKEREDAGK